MSGGSLDYLCYKVEEAADTIWCRRRSELHSEFVEHLRLVAKALHDIEWSMSGDYAEDGDIESIKRVLGK